MQRIQINPTSKEVSIVDDQFNEINLGSVNEMEVQAIIDTCLAYKSPEQIAEEATHELIKAGAEAKPELAKSLAVEWEVGKRYEVSNIVSYQDTVYLVLQAHTAQADWLPPNVPALLTPLKSTTQGAEISEWVQPLGGHDAYKIGDQVMYEGKKYESVIDNNVWPPVAYPQGWKEIN